MIASNSSLSETRLLNSSKTSTFLNLQFLENPFISAFFSLKPIASSDESRPITSPAPDIAAYIDHAPE